VNDAATGVLLSRFYSYWLGTSGQRHVSKPEALRLAQRDVRTDPSHPAWASPQYWTVFQLVGVP
jgi:CHAT domain-containing protein